MQRCSKVEPTLKPLVCVLSASPLTYLIPSSPSLSPQHAIIQPGVAGGVRLPAGRQWTQLHPVCGGGQQCPPGRVAGRGPGPGDRGAQRVNAGSPGCHRHRPDSEEHPSQHWSGVPHTAGPRTFESITDVIYMLVMPVFCLPWSSPKTLCIDSPDGCSRAIPPLCCWSIYFPYFDCCVPYRWTSYQAQMAVLASPL